MNKYNVEGVSTLEGINTTPETFSLYVVAASPEEARQAVIDDLTFHNRKDIEILSVECVS